MWATGDRNAFVSWRYLCFFKSLLAIGAVCLGTAGLAVAQGQIHLPPLVSQGPEAGRVPVVTTEQQERERAIKWQQERQEQVRRDTTKLFQLSAELKDSVDKMDANMLSLDMVKKAEAVEKLAKNVKNKMDEGKVLSESEFSPVEP